MTAVLEFCDRHSMLVGARKVLCAVSGGADSMLLLHLLLELAQERGFSLCCAHFNHGIRGDEADRDENFVKSACEKLGIPCVVGRADVPAYAREKRMGLEEAARDLRYRFLESTAEELGCGKIALAHNARDNAETMLMNLCRGAALRGVSGIAPTRGRIIRPLLCLDRPEIEEYLRVNGIDFIVDSSNLCDDYARNRMRHGAIESLYEYSNGFAKKMLSAAESMREDEVFLRSEAEKLCPENGVLSARELAALPRPISTRLVYLMAPSAGREHIEAVLELASAEKPHGQLSLPNMTVVREYDELRFGTAPSVRDMGEHVLCEGQSLQFGEYDVIFRKENAILPQNGEFFRFKTEAICGNIKVSSRKEGDSLRIAKRGVSKTLKKLFSEARIPPRLREGIPVIRDDIGVLGVFGFGEDARAAAEKDDAAVIIEIKNRA